MDGNIDPDSGLFWQFGSSTSLDVFLEQNKPSKILNHGDKPWTWVEGSKKRSESSLDREQVVESAKTLLAVATTDIQRIQADASIPVRGKPSQGIRSKKDLCTAVGDRFAADIRTLSLENGFTCGKWLLFRDGEKIDATFATLAHSLISGPLSKTPAMLMKAANLPADVSDPHYQHVICVYFPDVYDKEAALQVLNALVEHGINPSSVKSDLYTLCELDSKHPSKIRSSVWQPKELTDISELKKKVDKYWADRKEDGNAKRNAELEEKGVKRKAPEAVAQDLERSKAKRVAKEFDDSSDDEPVPRPLAISKAASTSSSKKATATSLKSKVSSKARLPAPAAHDAASSDDDIKKPSTSRSFSPPIRKAKVKGKASAKTFDESSTSEGGEKPTAKGQPTAPGSAPIASDGEGGYAVPSGSETE